MAATLPTALSPHANSIDGRVEGSLSTTRHGHASDQLDRCILARRRFGASLTVRHAAVHLLQGLVARVSSPSPAQRETRKAQSGTKTAMRNTPVWRVQSTGT